MRIAVLAVTGACLLAPVAALAQSEQAAPTQSAGAPAAAPASSGSSATAAASSTATSDPVICKYYYSNGAAIQRRECLTAHQWERQRNATQHAVSDFQLRSLTQFPH